MSYRLVALFALFAVFGLSSCEKENPIEKQEERIEAYIKAKRSKNPNMKLSNEGDVYYLYEPGDTTISVLASDSIYFYYAGTLVTDTMRYFDTNDKALAIALKLNTDSKTFGPLGVIVGNNNLLPGLNIGLRMTHIGDRGEIIFNSDKGFGDKANGIIPPLSPLIFKVVITRIRRN
jgi:FKBP-type peptidyl-prolyl cis-trans isomerase